MPRAGWLASGGLTAAIVELALGGELRWAPILGTVVALLCLVGCLRHQRRAAAATLVGIAAICLRLALAGTVAPDVAPPSLGTVSTATWSGDVTSLGSTDGGMQRVALVVRAASAGSTLDPTGGSWHIYAWLPRFPSVVAGDRITFRGRLEPVPADGSQFAAFLARSGMDGTARVASFDLESGGASAFAVVEDVRRAADQALARVLPEPEAGLASGILVGRRDRVARDVATDFATTGLSHVVAISGWNIAVVAGVIGSLLLAAGVGRRGRALAIIVVICAYTLLAGGGASVVRAALMCGVALLARESGRPGSAATALGLAVLGLLLLDPAMSGDVGFQLSVAATAGLLAWGSRVSEWLRGSRPGRARGWLAEALGVSLAAQAATLPLVLLHFGRLSLISPLANLLVAPLVSSSMLAGVVALVGGFVALAGAPALLLAPVSLAGWAVLGTMVAIAHELAALPFASLTLPPPFDLAAGLASAAALMAFIARDRRKGLADRTAPTDRPIPTAEHTPVPRDVPASPANPRSRSGASLPARSRDVLRSRRRVVVSLALCAALLVPVLVVQVTASVNAPPRLVVTVLDVGQGDSILLEGPRGGRMLIDGGPDPDRLMTVLDARLPPWDRRIDLVVLSHPHEDHASGLALLLARYRVGAVAENGMRGPGPGDAAFRIELAHSGLRDTVLAASDHLSLDGASLDVLWPRRGEVPTVAPDAGKGINDTSIVFDLRFGARRMVLTGDIEEEIDPQILASGFMRPGDPPVDVLKVAHHGSKTATTDAWLEALRPRVALISAGLGNPYGHPASSTIARLRDHGARVLRTDLDGSLQVSTDGTDLRMATSGGRPAASASVATALTTADRGAATTGRAVTTASRGSATTRATATLWGPRLSLFCAVPLPSLTATSGAVTIQHHQPHRPIGRPVASPPMPPTHPLAACYDQRQHDPIPDRGRSGSPGPVAFGQAGSTCHGRRRGGGIPGRAHRAPRPAGRSPPRGKRRPPARHGQGATAR